MNLHYAGLVSIQMISPVKGKKSKTLLQACFEVATRALLAIKFPFK
jgi:hypothetical protein